MTETTFTPANHAALWAALSRFQVDEPGTQFTFVKRLARENRWSPAFAQRVFEEYKKFVFLAATAEHPVTPSDQIDQAWHLHLAYTHSYWSELCAGILQRPLHHGPTKGGPAEDAKFFAWYARTLELYERCFGQAPPPDIWPAPAERFARALNFARLNTGEYWLVPKPDRAWRKAAVLALAALSLSLTATACTAESSFGGVFVLLIFGFIALLVYAFNANRRRDKNRQGDGSGCGTGGGGCGSDSNDGGGDGAGGGSSGCGGGGCGGGGCGS